MSKPTYEQLEQERNELSAQVERLRLAILNAIPFIPGGNVKANLRDAYDETLPASLASLKAQWQAEAVDCCEKEITASVNVLLKPHIAGVFAVIRQRAQE